MPNTAKKKHVELKIYGDNVDMTYVGRLLGLINDKEYAGLVKRPEVRNKILTVETTSLEDIGNLNDVSGLRLVMAAKKNDLGCINKRILFITEPLDQVTNFRLLGEKEVAISGKELSYIIATEVTV